MNNNGNCKVFVKNIPFNCTTEEFTKCFQSMNGYVDSVLATKINSTLLKGHGIVTFDNEDNANKLLNEKIKLGDRELQMYKYNANRDTKVYKLFLRHSSNDLTDEQIKEEFSKYGNISYCYSKQNFEGKKYSVVGYTDKQVILNLLRKTIKIGEHEVSVFSFKKNNRNTNNTNNRNNNNRNMNRNRNTNNRNYKNDNNYVQNKQ